MAIRTYYWTQKNASFYKYYKNKFLNPDKFYFKYGNAGDIFNIDLIKYIYNEQPINFTNGGNRLLLVGSIMSKIQEGDIINGIGWKGNNLKDKSEILETIQVFGVRGPLTKSFFEKHNTDLSNLKFELDPGLLIKEVYNIDVEKASEKQVIFIPHYQDIAVYNGVYPKGVKSINIDNSPKKIAKEILKAKIVYASSLHGIIFSHALGKPCVFVKPQSDEPIFKYRDYYLSIGHDLPNPIRDIYSINFLTDKATELKKHIGVDDFYFPSFDVLSKSKIIY